MAWTTCIVLVAAIAMLGSAEHDVTDDCLHCLCELLSSCDSTKGCEVVEIGLKCGMFDITELYWKESKHVLEGDNENNIGAFERCTRDPFCAVKAIRSYYDKYNVQCMDKDDICANMANLHFSGPYCKEDSRWKNVVACYNRRLSSMKRYNMTDLHSEQGGLDVEDGNTTRWKSPGNDNLYSAPTVNHHFQYPTHNHLEKGVNF